MGVCYCGGSEMQAPLIIAVACLISCAPHWKITSYYLAKIRCRKSSGSQEQFQLTFSVSELPAICIILTDKTKGTETGSPRGTFDVNEPPPHQGSAPHSEVFFSTPILFIPKQETHGNFTETSSCKICNRLKGGGGLHWKARVQSWQMSGSRDLPRVTSRMLPSFWPFWAMANTGLPSSSS